MYVIGVPVCALPSIRQGERAGRPGALDSNRSESDPSMPQRDTSGIGERVPRELIDADFTIASSLVQMADDELHRGNGQLASQLLQRAEHMLEGIEERLLRMTPSQREPFEPRCAELAAAIKTAQAQSEPDAAG